jgi:Isochorismatase family.
LSIPTLPSLADELAPADGDIVIEGKRGLDTFARTNLDFILRSKGRSGRRVRLHRPPVGHQPLDRAVGQPHRDPDSPGKRRTG